MADITKTNSNMAILATLIKKRRDSFPLNVIGDDGDDDDIGKYANC